MSAKRYGGAAAKAHTIRLNRQSLREAERRLAQARSRSQPDRIARYEADVARLKRNLERQLARPVSEFEVTVTELLVPPPSLR